MKVTRSATLPPKFDPCPVPYPGYEDLSRKSMVYLLRGRVARRSLYTLNSPYSLRTVEQLAQQGFIPCKKKEEEGNNNHKEGEVLCTYCRIQIADCQDEDNICEIHQRESPSCLAAFEELGPQYLYPWDSDDEFAFYSSDEEGYSEDDYAEKEDSQDSGIEEDKEGPEDQEEEEDHVQKEEDHDEKMGNEEKEDKKREDKEADPEKEDKDDKENIPPKEKA